jgi:hypothetical protein
MDSRDRSELHGPWPSPAEELEATYGDEWEIWRERLPDGSHGVWCARRWAADGGPDEEGEQVRAATIEALGAALRRSRHRQGGCRR